MDLVRPPKSQAGRSGPLPWRVASLYLELDSRMIKSKFEKTPFEFLPQSDLEEVITEDRVVLVLRPYTADRQLLDFILEKARKLFAITAYIELDGSQLGDAMSFFRSRGFDDRRLPIKKMLGREILKEEEMRYDKLVAGLEDYDEDEMSTKAFNAVDHPLTSTEGPLRFEKDRIWTLRRILKFQDAQKLFLAPILSDEDSNHDFCEHTVPFIERFVTYTAGSFGEVSKCKIHKSHILDGKRPNNVSYEVFAVKQIKPTNDIDRNEVAHHWASEVRAMAMMNKLDHKGHIVHFVTAFRRGFGDLREHYLITEWADGGNLHNLWKERPNPELNAATVKSVIGQLLGIAEAFRAVHNLKSGDIITGASYRHGDLKPANILWFKPQSGNENDIGTLKICDWGEAKSKQFPTVMRSSRTTADFGMRRYQPPEVGTGVGSMIQGTEDKRRSRLYDIWAVGCITLEFAVWLLYGLEGLKEFNSSVRHELNMDSPFYQIRGYGSHKVAWVHNVVTHWMEHMSRDEACRAGATALGDLIEVVEKGLLVVDLPRAGGAVNIQFLEDGQAAGTPNQHRELTPQVNKSGIIDGNPVLVPPQTEGISASILTFRINLADRDEFVPPPWYVAPGPKRLRADQLCDKLTKIASSEEKNYWSIQSDTTIPDVPFELYVNAPKSSKPDSRRRAHWSEVDHGKLGKD